jgi:hypothetical protein
MPSPFDNAIAAGLQAVNAVAGRTIRYVRGEQSVEPKGWTGEYRERVVKEQGAQVTLRSRDYLVPVSALKFGSTQIIPQLGDLIFETIGGTEKKFVVQELEDGKPFRYADAGRTVFRIHTEAR